MKWRHLVFLNGAALAALAVATAPAAAGSGTEQFDEAMKPILASYLAIHERLAADSTQGVGAAAESIKDAASKLDAAAVTGEHAAQYKDLPAGLQREAEAVGKAPDLDAAREAFKRLSELMARWAKVSRPEGVNVMACSMAKASWLQKVGEARNPYYGKSMLDCGEVVDDFSHSTKHEHGSTSE